MSLAQEKITKMTKALRQAGVRVTKQRIALLAVLGEADDHPDAEELLRRTKRVEPGMSLATVYRTLSVLEAEGVVHRHSFEGGGARFETADQSHHDHIVDLDSGEVFEFNSAKIEQLQTEIAREMGYEVIHHRMELYCRKLGSGSGKGD
ncbi:Fur family transcriptional regulator, ferric uptake regulator [Cognatiyoonia koreensis]|uniref:Ferric uptake regulation protein n=1 Tax=Cognatiyoonia koreensis TaxID=364200 RepID=A0A1I0QW10_9RHOB|nr:Fur family transcriptional regulator [Cognatiyoonia koreensis]SEW31926.1 Fur family transcriptional regulator, ferric uptake regulator [Cognatiyoonia koreensis]